MNPRTRLKQLLLASLVIWLGVGSLVGYITFDKFIPLIWAGLIGGIFIAGLTSMLALNQSQMEVAESNRSHSRTKRQVQEQQLKLDRLEYDGKKASELRRIVLNSTQEKDHSLRNMAAALDHAMDEIIELTDDQGADALAVIRTRAEGMKRYAADLQALAQLQLRSELPNYQELDFLGELNLLVDDWISLGKIRGVKLKLDNPEDQMPVMSDPNWLKNLLSRIVQSLIRMNEDSTLNISLIGYLDAALGDSLRINFTIDGRQFKPDQLKHIMTEYISIIEHGQEVGPGLTYVVTRRLAQMLNGYVEVTNTGNGVNVLVVLPRNPQPQEKEDFR
ncbi:MAG: hypothetical protein MUQ43_07430 [Reinekea forsetii]|uniref:ATP-binding protein n=1 Tax=Reinekea sp. TaxID=1970455 RepID=UPI00257C485D|nr:ATP-binding protein [Reinekea sp.]MDO7642874.1 hypothetical protein [Reinekea forsetii]MDO7674242.1 hypothetical protein [Reinekea forsetii]